MLKILKNDEDGEISDGRSSLDELARQGARRMLAEALEAEVAAYLELHRGARDERGRALVVRNGRGVSREVMTGVGPLEVAAPRVNDKRVSDGERQRFISLILPPYLRKSKAITELLPALYLRGLSTGDFRDGLAAILGDNAAGFSPSVITRLTAAWQGEYMQWRARTLADRDYVYVWADGVHFNVRLEDERLAALVLTWPTGSCCSRRRVGGGATAASCFRWCGPARNSRTACAWNAAMLTRRKLERRPLDDEDQNPHAINSRRTPPDQLRSTTLDHISGRVP